MCESNMAALCKSNGKDTQSKLLAERNCRGTAQARHGNGMVCLNWSLSVLYGLSTLYNVNRLVCVTEVESVFRAVRTESQNRHVSYLMVNER
jgi:hypothetical protein